MERGPTASGASGAPQKHGRAADRGARQACPARSGAAGIAGLKSDPRGGALTLPVLLAWHAGLGEHGAAGWARCGLARLGGPTTAEVTARTGIESSAGTASPADKAAPPNARTSRLALAGMLGEAKELDVVYYVRICPDRGFKKLIL